MKSAMKNVGGWNSEGNPLKEFTEWRVFEEEAGENTENISVYYDASDETWFNNEYFVTD